MRSQNLRDYKKPESWNRGASFLKEILWIIIFKPMVSNNIPGTFWRKFLLQLFGARIGRFNRLHPGLKVKMPWRLIIGDYCWLGEDTWIDNLNKVQISNNVCISQGVYFCTGSHNYKKETFDLITKPIFIDEQVWIAAKSIIGPGYTIGKSSIVTMGSIVTKDIPPSSIYKSHEKIILKNFHE